MCSCDMRSCAEACLGFMSSPKFATSWYKQTTVILDFVGLALMLDPLS